ncbi:hypothetical protein OIU80_16620 [Flavobacterium sp. LS1R47]|jgi:hypothetical protein|uniref:Uncharacterized protein n=1 Tax=Flavobacterium frigoritolerans TaxID=2987686 RepID=A0A9X3HN35_9FLAO|nr:hypothetical protein [Flavobacterium frigoritolerans]MCV9933908.1 hypothetical protein [Flavobacterium frigoritolerans]
MLKTILNLNGVELLSKNQQKNIIGKGYNGPISVPRCEKNDWAPSGPGVNPADYPNYPCIGPQERPCLPTLLEDGSVTGC